MDSIGIKRLGGVSVLRARSFSAVLVTAALLAVAYFGGWVLLAAVAASLLLCLIELYRALEVKGFRPAPAYGAVIGLALAAGVRFDVRLVYAALAFGLLGLLLLPRLLRRSRRDLLATALGALYIGLALSYAILIRALPEGFALLLIVFWGVGAADIGAYGLGSLIGKHKLAPRISPSKTWEGYLGGLIACTLVVFLLNALLPVLNGWAVVLVGVVLATCDLAGDLLASAVKRYTGVKDYGKLLPGHGGLLDRLDGTLFALPVAYALIRLIL